MCLCYLYSGKETGGQEEWIQVREKSKWSKYQKFIKNLFSQQFINSLYFPRNLSHHEDLGVARFLPRFDEEFDYFLIISPTKKIIHISFYKTKKNPAGCWQELKKFAKNWTFARRWSWQCKINWDIFVWYSICQLEQYIYNIETAMLSFKSRLRRSSQLFWMKSVEWRGHQKEYSSDVFFVKIVLFCYHIITKWWRYMETNRAPRVESSSTTLYRCDPNRLFCDWTHVTAFSLTLLHPPPHTPCVAILSYNIIFFCWLLCVLPLTDPEKGLIDAHDCRL